ncbi:hypothetical protein A7M48_22090 [Acinetobacter baumannii]|nr:hypothetical protein A7M48_22090 [Acinetobacter baumannii]
MPYAFRHSKVQQVWSLEGIRWPVSGLASGVAVQSVALQVPKQSFPFGVVGARSPPRMFGVIISSCYEAGPKMLEELTEVRCCYAVSGGKVDRSNV